MSAQITITIPVWLDMFFAWPVMVYRKHKYGYEFRRIYLGEEEWTILDQKDYYRLRDFKWIVYGTRYNLYAVRNKKISPNETRTVRLHREIMNAPTGLLVDHKNGNSLDNRRDNLRLATHFQNSCNARKSKSNFTSQYKGVQFRKKKNRWISVIYYHQKAIWLGTFKSEIDAAKAYDEAAKKYHGEFARLNFPEPPRTCLRQVAAGAGRLRRFHGLLNRGEYVELRNGP